MLNRMSNGSPLIARLKYSTNGIYDTIDAVFMLALDHPDNPFQAFHLSIAVLFL